MFPFYSKIICLCRSGARSRSAAEFLTSQGSVGRTDLPGGDYSTLQDSLRRLIALLPKETIVHSGHGPDTTLNEEFHNNPYLEFLN